MKQGGADQTGAAVFCFMKRNKIIRKTLLLFGALAFALGALNGCGVNVPDGGAAQVPAVSRIIVSLGDSYSSGEGIEPFYSQNDPNKYTNHDFLAHRSEKSWAGRLTLPGVEGTMAEHRGENWFFTAVSGAETKDILGSQEKTGKELINSGGNKYYYTYPTQNLAPQIEIFEQLGGRKADYVTLTLGGNDAEFSEIVTQAIAGHTVLGTTALGIKLAALWNRFYSEGGIRDSLIKAYRDIAEAAGPQAKIIVAGYPRLIGENGSRVFYSREAAALLNASVSEFNNQIEQTVNSLRAEGMNIYFVSVENAFDSHEAYAAYPDSEQDSAEVEFLTRVHIGANEQDIDASKAASAYSMHPNDLGAEAYRRCVQRLINELEAGGTGSNRDTVIAIDSSQNAEGAFGALKTAAEGLVHAVVSDDERMGLVRFGESAAVLSDFSHAGQVLIDRLEELEAGGGANIEAALEKSVELLDKGCSEERSIVLIGAGLPSEGLTGDKLIKYANSIRRNGVRIYALCCFNGLDAEEEAEAYALMQGIASPLFCFSADDIERAASELAASLNGQRYLYASVAGDCEASCAFGGELLDSANADMLSSAEFGTLLIEGASGAKIFRLKEGAEYELAVRAKEGGTVSCMLGIMDARGDFTDIRRFESIELESGGALSFTASNAPETLLRADKNGDGKADTSYRAEKNGIGKALKPSALPLVLGATALIAVGAAVAVMLKKRKYSV